MFGGCKPPHLYLTSSLDVYEVFEHPHMLWMGNWVHPYCVTPVHALAKFKKTGGIRMSFKTIMVFCLVALYHPICFLLDLYEMFEHLYMLWMCMFIWVHPYCVTPVQVGTIFWKIGGKGEEKYYHGVMFRGCKPPHLFRTSYLMYIKCMSFFICCGWAYGCTLTLLHLCRWGPNFGKLRVRANPNNILSHVWRL